MQWGFHIKGFLRAFKKFFYLDTPKYDTSLTKRMHGAIPYFYHMYFGIHLSGIHLSGEMFVHYSSDWMETTHFTTGTATLMAAVNSGQNMLTFCRHQYNYSYMYAIMVIYILMNSTMCRFCGWQSSCNHKLALIASSTILCRHMLFNFRYSLAFTIIDLNI